MNNLPKDDPIAYPVLDRWMARRLWAGAHRAFLQHIKVKYPNIKCFVWGSIAQPWNGTAIGELRDIVDGVITDPYFDTLFIHHTLSGLKTILPDAEHLVLLMGSSDISQKHIRAATAYLNGASAIGFFEKVPNNQELWDANVSIWKKLNRLPVLKITKPKVLIVTGNSDNGYSTSRKMLPFFKNPAVLVVRDAAEVDLKQYRMVVLHHCAPFRNDIAIAKYRMKGYGPDDQQLKYWVFSGGILVITSPILPQNSSSFLVEEQIAWTTNRWVSIQNQPVGFSCEPDVAEKYNIKSRYTLLAGVREISWGKDISYDRLPVGGVTKYGQGLIVILPVFHRDSIMLDNDTPEEYRTLWLKEMTKYIADVVRGVVKLYDGSGILIRELNPPDEPYGLELRDRDNGINIRTIFEVLKQKPSSEIIKSGDYILGS